ncbi:MAG: hypothetical protein MZW92_28650 [Comamonadaceae bacterium]|nr:hypothetical protein [Comamonadaceae bacterium]
MLTDFDAQIPERLRLDGEDLALASLPLAAWRPAGGPQPAFAAPHAALRRGYVGSWAIDGQRLQLLALYGRLAGGAEATLATLFPGRAAPVHADWYSGTLRVRRGPGRGWSADGRAEPVARELLIEVDRGRVVGRRERLLPAAAGLLHDVGGATPGTIAAGGQPARRP